MKQINLKEHIEEGRFAFRAARFFDKNPECHTYTEAAFKTGSLFALRWGMGTGVAVIKLDPDHEPLNFIDILSHNKEVDAEFEPVADPVSPEPQPKSPRDKRLVEALQNCIYVLNDTCGIPMTLDHITVIENTIKQAEHVLDRG